MTATDEQLDLFTVQDVVDLQPVPPRLEDLPMLALDPALGEPGWDRHRQYRDWCSTFGSFGSVFRCHGWVLCPTSGDIPRDRERWPDHELREFSRHLHCEVVDHRRPAGVAPSAWTRCQCVTADLSMVACACGWESEPSADYQGGVLPGLEHIWGTAWLEVPPVPRWTYEGPGKGKDAAAEKWIARAVKLGHDEAQLRAGGPVRTLRQPGATRHVMPGTPWRGYDVGVLDPAAKSPKLSG